MGVAWQHLRRSYPWPEVRRFFGMVPIRFDAVLTGLVWAFFQLSWVRWATGLGWWFVAEYWLHRGLLHRPSPFSARHWAHHLDPADDRWWPVPPPWTLALAGGAALVFMGTAGWFLGGGMLTGFLTGLLYFEWCHYAAHHPITPWTPIGRWIKRRHLQHHDINETVWYGISPGAGVMDWVFGTGPREPVPLRRAQPPQRKQEAPSPFLQWWAALPEGQRKALEVEASCWWLSQPGVSVMELARRRESLSRRGVTWQRALEAWCVKRGLWRGEDSDPEGVTTSSSPLLIQNGEVNGTAARAQRTY